MCHALRNMWFKTGVLYFIACIFCTQVLAETDSREQALVGRFVEYFNARNSAPFDRLFDTDMFCDRVAKRLHTSVTKRAIFKFRTCDQFKRASFSDMLFTQLYSVNPVAKAVGVTRQGRPVIRVIAAAGGYEFIELVIRESDVGGEQQALLIHDVVFASRGQLHSKSTAMTMALLGGVNASTLKQLLGINHINEEVLTTFVEMSKAVKMGDFTSALRAIDTLPESIKTAKIILLAKTGYAMHVSDDSYRAALSELNANFGDDPTLGYALLDHFFLTEDYQRALASVERIERRYGSDATVLNLKANALTMLQRLDEALNVIDMAIQQEPTLAELYETKMYLLSLNQRHNDLLVLIKRAVEHGVATQLAATLSDSAFDDFRKSALYEDWIDAAVYGDQ
jgi:hypothetical protein